MTHTTLRPADPSLPTPLVDDSGQIRAILTGSSIEQYAQRPTEAPSGSVIIVSCGTHDARDPDPSEPGMLRWLDSAWAEFDESCNQAMKHARTLGHELVVHPGAGGRLSDAVCTRSWIGRLGDDAPKLLVDPIGWITPSMLDDAPDHLVRFVDACNEFGAWGLRIRSCERSGDNLVACPIGSGVLDPELVSQTLDAIGAPIRVEWTE